MIKINLIGDKDSSALSGYFQIAIYFLSIGILVLAIMSINSFLRYEIELITQEDRLLRTQLAELKKTTREVRDLEKKRENLKQKLDVIESLKQRKVGPVRVLDGLNISIPEKSWVLELREKDGVLRIDGLALDNQTIADFIKTLERSEYFPRVDLLEARQEIWQGVKMKRYAISARLNFAGKEKAEEKTGQEKI